MKIVKANKTSIACPSQWDAWTDDDQYVYMRYRHGYGYAKIYDSPNWWESDVIQEGHIVASFEFGHPLDGYMELEEFCRHAGLELDLE